MWEHIRPYAATAMAAIGIAVGMYAWADMRFAKITSQLARFEEKTLLNLLETRSGIVEAIDRNEEWLSKEHQQNTAHLSGMLMNIGHGLGYAERMADEKDHAPDK